MVGPYPYFGSKARLAPWIVEQMPPHRVYVEPYAGSAAVFFSKRPAAVNIINDTNGSVVACMRVLQDAEQFQVLKHRLAYTPYAKDEWDRAVAILARAETEPGSVALADEAWAMIVAHSQGFSGRPSAFSHSTECNAAAEWGRAKKRLDEFNAHLDGVQIQNRPAMECLDLFDGPDTLFYLDPPYVPSTRRSGGYRKEMTEADHEALVARVQALAGMVILSGYQSATYTPLELAGWTRLERRVACYAAARTRGTGLRGDGACAGDQERIECLWVSPNAAVTTLFS